MFGVWLERRCYRKRVLETLMLMLEGLGLKSPKILLRHYPGVENAIVDHFHRGVGYRDCCIAVVASVLPDQIEHHYRDDQRALILDQLTAKGMPLAAKAPLARAILSAEDFAYHSGATHEISPLDYRTRHFQQESRAARSIPMFIEGWPPHPATRQTIGRRVAQAGPP